MELSKKEFEAKLVKEFPAYFIDMYGSRKITSLSFGLEIEPGWFDIIWRLCDDIKKLDTPENFKFVQIKEKFGGLRVYAYNSNKEIEDLVEKAEKEAEITCEMCGTKENVTTEGSWIKVLCQPCRIKRNSK